MASQSKIPVEHEVRIREVKEEPPVYGWAYFTYLALYFSESAEDSEPSC